eukprot:98983_1
MATRLFAFWILCLSLCQSANVLVIGDSWASLGGPALRDILDSHDSGLTVASYATTGSTTEMWVQNVSKISDIVTENPDAQVIWLSLGGDDLIYLLSLCTTAMPIDDCTDMALKRITNNTQTFMNVLFKNHPKIKVVQFGYDIPNFSDNVRRWCNISGDIVIEQCAEDIFCWNSQMIKLQYQFVDYVAAYYSDQMYNYTSLNLLGTLQAYDHVPGAYRTHPNLNYWTPANLMLACIHATETGFKIIMEQIWELYFCQLVDKCAS